MDDNTTLFEQYPSDYPLDGNAACRNCHREFTPRKGSGGHRQVYCSSECRREADAERKANSPQRAQRAPQRAENLALEPLKGEFAMVAPDAGDAGGWDWINDAADIVCPEQQAVAVYTNTRGDVVIRQQQSWYDDADQFVVVRPEHLQALIDRLRVIVGIGGAGR
jgi:hypothetical protein